tara:strand:+ start:700 stop:1173 length:474 start_codon:yes stop_codon:yes gene_type:complete
MNFRKMFSKKDTTAASKMMEDASYRGRRHYLEQEILATIELSGDSGRDDFLDDAELRLELEEWFMWGWYFAYAEEAGEWPTPPDMRAGAHMLKYLMDHHGFDFKAAKVDVQSLDRNWNAAEPLFEAVQNKGRESFYQPEVPFLAHMVSALFPVKGEP